MIQTTSQGWTVRRLTFASQRVAGKQIELRNARKLVQHCADQLVEFDLMSVLCRQDARAGDRAGL